MTERKFIFFELFSRVFTEQFLFCVFHALLCNRYSYKENPSECASQHVFNEIFEKNDNLSELCTKSFSLNFIFVLCSCSPPKQEAKPLETKQCQHKLIPQHPHSVSLFHKCFGHELHKLFSGFKWFSESEDGMMKATQKIGNKSFDVVFMKM